MKTLFAPLHKFLCLWESTVWGLEQHKPLKGLPKGQALRMSAWPPISLSLIHPAALYIGHFIVGYLVAKPLIWSSGWPCCDRDQYLVSMIKKSNLHLKCSKVCIIKRSHLASPLFKGLATKRATVKWTILIIFSFCQHTVGEVFHLWFELWDPPLLLQPWGADTCAQEGCSWHPH